MDDKRQVLTAAMGRYAEGDDEAFGEVYDLLAPRLYAFFMRQTYQASRSEDLVQQTLLQMHSARSSYSLGSDVVPWALAIGRRLVVDSRRHSRWESLFQTAEEGAAALDPEVERFDIPEAWVMTKELSSRARQALDQMPEPHRVAYLLLREEGLSVAEAAEVLGTTPTAIKLRAHRAYEALRTALFDPTSPEVSR